MLPVGVFLFVFFVSSLKALRRLYVQVYGAFGFGCERASDDATGASASPAFVRADGGAAAAALSPVMQQQFKT